METAVKPGWLMWAALACHSGPAAFVRGWLGAGLVLLLFSAPLDIVANRLAALRLRPLPVRMLSRRALWPAAGLALLALGWWEYRHNSGWGALVRPALRSRSRKRRASKGQLSAGGEIWLLSRRNAIFAAIPFALAGAWTSYLLALLVYALGSSSSSSTCGI